MIERFIDENLEQWLKAGFITSKDYRAAVQLWFGYGITVDQKYLWSRIEQRCSEIGWTACYDISRSIDGKTIKCKTFKKNTNG